MAKVKTERKGRSLIVTINRPEVRNAADGETAGLLSRAVAAFSQDERLDVLILTGARDLAFCARADLKNVGDFINSALNLSWQKDSDATPPANGLRRPVRQLYPSTM